MAYKAFNPDFTCRGKQYKENTTYEENGNEICEAGVIHYCENPFDVLDYYPLVNENGEISEFAEVEPLGKVFKRENKCATNKLRIKAKLGLKGFIKACIDFTLEKTKIEEIEDGIENDNGNNSAKIGSSGDYAKIGSSGNYAKIGSSGDSAKIGSSGDSAQIGSSGDSAKIGSSGNYAKIGSSGDSAQIGSSGDYAKITSKGKHSVVMAAGYQSQAKAKKGSWITLAEWVRTDDEDKKGFCIWIPKCVKTEYVDGERIKEDTFYKLVDGEFKEVEEN
nr:MAG TPA: hypothetical protein [Bacteriophage sp.]